MYIGLLHVKYRLLLAGFHENFNFLDSFSKNTQIRTFMKIRQVRAELFIRTDRQTYMTKQIDAFRNFVNAPKNNPQRHKQQDSCCQDHL